MNQRDPTAVDDLVAADYTGGGYGWPGNRDSLRAFYAEQAATRPDWTITVQETVELDDAVVVLARAGGHVVEDGGWRRRDVEWLAAYRVRDGRIREIRILSLVSLPSADSAGSQA